jgi:hypothetical protein
MLIGEMRQGALEVDHADNARVTLAGAALAPSLPAVVGDLAAPHGGAILELPVFLEHVSSMWAG